MTIDEAREIVANALVQHCEDNISSDAAAKEQVDAAWLEICKQLDGVADAVERLDALIAKIDAQDEKLNALITDMEAQANDLES